MVSKSILVSKLSPYKGIKKIIVYNQNTDDIVKQLIKSHNENAKEYDKIYQYFDANNKIDIAKKLFDFCKKNILYRIESGSKQSLRTPAAILINGSGDCKQYSQFIGGCLDAINRNSKKIDWCYRFASYNYNKDIQHVFIVLKINNKEIWIDPVLNELNEKKEYNFKIDKNMSLYQVSGFENDEIGKIRLKLPKIKIAKGIKRAVTDVKKVQIKKGIDRAITDVRKVALKVGLFPARQAFLGIVSVNAFNLAKMIAKGILKDRRKIEDFWKDLGGDFSALLKAVNNKQSEFKVSGYSKIGVEPATTTAAAVASPIIVAITKILKDLGIDTKDIAGSVSKLAENQAVKLIENNGKDLIESGYKSILKKNSQGVAEVQITQATENEIQQSNSSSSSSEPAKKNNTILYVGAAAVALFLISKK